MFFFKSTAKLKSEVGISDFSGMFTGGGKITPSKTC